MRSVFGRIGGWFSSKKDEIILFLVSGLISIIVLEFASLGVYHVIHQKPFDRKDIKYRLTAPHITKYLPQELTGTPPPHVANKVLHPYLGFAINTQSSRTNGFGFYGPQPFLKRKEGAISIAVVGGSVALNFAASSKNLIKALHDYPHYFADQEINITCLAIDGYKQPQQLIAVAYMLSIGAEYDMIINIDGFNEVALPYSENIPARVYPFYPRSWNLYSRKGFDLELTLQAAEINKIKLERAKWRRVFSVNPVRRSVFCLTLWDSIDRRLQYQWYLEDLKMREMLKISSENFHNTGPFIPYQSEEALFRESVRMWKDGSIQLAKLCAANDIQYFHFLQPNQYDTGSKILSEEEKQIAYVEGEYDFKYAVQQGYPLLRKAGLELIAEGVVYTDLTMLLKNEPRTIYFDECCHLNALGNEIMASAIAVAIIAERMNEK